MNFIIKNMNDNLKDLKKHFDSEGYIVLEDVISDLECEKFKKLLNDDTERYTSLYYTSPNVSEHGLENKSTEKIVFNLHNKNLKYYEMISNQRVIEFLDIALKEGSYMNSEPYLLLNNSARCPIDQVKSQQLHIDSRLPGTKFPLMIIALWMLDDFTEFNGATRIIPKSHLKSEYPENGVKYDSEIIVKGKKGSVLLFNGALWHGGGENISGKSRWSAIFSYGRWFLKPSFDFNKNMPFSIYSELTDDQKELLGYKCNPPSDEFTRIRRRSEQFDQPFDYLLPNND